MRSRSLPFLVCLFAVLLVLGSAPALALAPEPVVPVDDGAPAQEEPPPQEAPARLCADGSTAGAPRLALVRQRSGGFTKRPSGVLTSQPGPVVPVGPDVEPRNGPSTSCRQDVSLSLTITAPDGRKPQGVDAWFDEVLVTQGALEAGYHTNQPAADRSITLKQPPSEWEVVGLSCTCGGATAAATPVRAQTERTTGPFRLASYPGPVVAVDPRVSGGCAGALPPAPATATLAGAAARTARAAGAMVLTSYPRPVVPVDDGDQPAPEPEPEPPAAEAPRISWSQRSVTISDPDGVGGTFSCAWEVELVKGDLEIRTITDPKGEEGKIKFALDPLFSHPDAEPHSMRGAPSASEKLRMGPWRIEAQFPYQWELQSSTCTDADGTTPSSANGATGSAGVDGGDQVTCTFELQALVPREGPWRADEGPLKINCGPINDTLDGLTEQVSISLVQDGDRIVGRGNGVTWRFDRDGTDPRRFRGTLRQPAAGGTIEFRADLTLVDSEHMKGSFRAKAKIRGQTCRLSRSIDMRYRGR